MKKICPIIKSECLEHGCEFYIHLIGKNPQTGAEQDDWGCAVKFLPILLIENANETRKNAASTDKVANEVRGHHVTFLHAIEKKISRQLGNNEPISHS